METVNHLISLNSCLLAISPSALCSLSPSKADAKRNAQDLYTLEMVFLNNPIFLSLLNHRKWVR